jgi:hypothetical protein
MRAIRSPISIGSPTTPRDIDTKMIDSSAAIQSSSSALAVERPVVLFAWCR